MMSDFFSNNELLVCAKAPGRMDVMGGIADYSGSLLLQIPIKQTTSVSIQKRTDGVFHLRTQVKKNKAKDFSIHLSVLKNKSLQEAGNIIKSYAGGEWAVYVLGCFLVLQKEKQIEISGANVLIESDVPWGKGVSSSAALEVATMNALAKLYKLALEKEELPVLAQMAENLVAGAPCGLMDQLSSHLGQKNKLLPLICQPHRVFGALKIPRGISFIGIDSGIRHAVSGSSYSDVRTAAFMGYSIIALHEGAFPTDLKYAQTTGDWSNLPFQGFLANISSAQFREKYFSLLPEKLSGKDFLHQYQVSIDQVTTVDIHTIYRPRVCAAHPVFENERIKEFATLLSGFKNQDDKTAVLKRMGKLMLESHQSYSAVGLGNEHTDEIVQMVMEAGNNSNIFGARITGGGCGGTVCVLTYGIKGMMAVKEVFKKYKTKYQQRLYLFTGSSQGAYFVNQNFLKTGGQGC
jgi:L-arabinokinase